jgi:hypothetical protein
MYTSSSQKSRRQRGFGALFMLALCTLLVACGSDTVQPLAVCATSCQNGGEKRSASSLDDLRQHSRALLQGLIENCQRKGKRVNHD